jgi:prolipoprotein diacylglyceryltransferase
MNGFSLILGLGATIGLLRLLQSSPEATRIRWLVAGLITLFGGLVGARLAFVVIYHVYFSTHSAEILKINLGGLSWPGALAGAILFGWLALKILGLGMADGADRLSRILLPVAAAVWAGAWLTGSAYGQPLPAHPWWGMNMPDDAGITTLRVPLQPAALISLVILLASSEFLLQNAKRKGIKAACSGFILSIHTLLFSFMRYDSVQHIIGLRLDSWAALFWSLVFLFLIFFFAVKRKPRQLIETE